jgi:thioredoxin-related protein
VAVSGILLAAALASGCRSSQKDRGAERRRPPSVPVVAHRPPAADVAGEFIAKHQLAGRVALVEFGRADCAMSDQGLTEMVRLHQAKALGEAAMVRVEVGEDEKAVKDYYAAKNAPFPVHRDRDMTLSHGMNATAIPTFVLLDKFGHVRYRGGFPQKELGDWVKTLQAETADPGPKAALFGVQRLDVPKLLAETRLPDLAGAVKPLGAYAGAGGLLLMFVDTHCPYCATAMKDWATVASVVGRQNISCVLVNLGDPADRVQAHYARIKPATPVVFDVQKVAQRQWAISSVPTVMLIEGGGASIYRGPATWEPLAKAWNDSAPSRKGTIQFNVRGTSYG